jgi:hypothetical protein
LNKSISFPCYTAILMIAGILLTSCGCKKDNTTSTTGDLQVVPRDAAYAGCYPVVGTSQTGFWDGPGNSITAPAPDEAFYGQALQLFQMQTGLMLMHGMSLLAGRKTEMAKTFTVPVQCVLTLRF